MRRIPAVRAKQIGLFLAAEKNNLNNLKTTDRESYFRRCKELELCGFEIHLSQFTGDVLKVTLG